MIDTRNGLRFPDASEMRLGPSPEQETFQQLSRLDRPKVDLDIRMLTAEDLMKMQGFDIYVTTPAGEQAEWVQPDLTGLAPVTQERIKRASARMLTGLVDRESWMRMMAGYKPHVRLRMLVKGGAHAGYVRLNDDNTIHSYAWFEEN